jgi:hypothetical protein
MVKIWYIWGTKNIAMLQSMKKPDPRKKLGKAKTVVAYEKKSAPSSAPMSISKSDAEAHMGKMNKMFEEQKDIQEGEKEFGADYKDLGLKSYKYRQGSPTGGNMEEKRGYRVKSYDENKDSPYNEEIERVSPSQDIVRVYRTGSGKDYSLEYGQNVKKDLTTDKRGNPATVYEETIKGRAERMRAEKKARENSIAQAAINKAEADKAKAKAGSK